MPPDYYRETIKKAFTTAAGEKFKSPAARLQRISDLGEGHIRFGKSLADYQKLGITPPKTRAFYTPKGVRREMPFMFPEQLEATRRKVQAVPTARPPVRPVPQPGTRAPIPRPFAPMRTLAQPRWTPAQVETSRRRAMATRGMMQRRLGPQKYGRFQAFNRAMSLARRRGLPTSRWLKQQQYGF